MNNEEWTNKEAGKVIRDLHTYCFCSQPTWRKMGYSFSEGDFDLLHNLIEGQTAEIKMLKHDREKLKRELITVKSEAIKEFAEELEYFVLNEDVEVVKPKCKDYKSYINGANQFRHQIKNGINDLIKEMMEQKNDFNRR